MKIILATKSKYRINAFRELNIPFQAINHNINERFEGRPKNPKSIVKTLSLMKVKSIQQFYNDSLIIGFDSLGFFKGELLEKPENKLIAKKRIRMLSDQSFDFYTGVSIFNTNTNVSQSFVEKTIVKLRRISYSEIMIYLNNTDDYLDFSIGFNPINGYSSSFVNSIYGCYNNFINGIPIAHILKMKTFSP